MSSFDLIVIGGGPAGYVAAIRAAQLGLSVACVEKESALGGTCLRVGCIPSKALLESSELYERAEQGFAQRGIECSNLKLDLTRMLQHKDQVVGTLVQGVASLLKKNKIERFTGHARLAGDGVVQVEGDESHELNGRHILIATGSVPATLPSIDMNDPRVGTSTEALEYEEVPRHLVVVGAGYIGLELGTVWRRLGSKVTVVEFLDRIFPGMDSDLAAQAQKVLTKQGIEFQLSSRATGIKFNRRTVDLEINSDQTIRCDRVLIAIGRRPNSANLGLEDVGVETDDKGFIQVDQAFQTTVPSVYAIGDVIGGAMLAHKAEEEGVACVERIVTGYGHVNYDAIPAIVYTHPEIATVGFSEDQLKADGREYRKGVFSFAANGRARAMDDTEGQVKMLADAVTDRVLGVHIIGPRAGDLIAEAAAGIAFGASSEDIARVCHAHPTLSECVKEAALAVDGRALHR